MGVLHLMCLIFLFHYVADFLMQTEWMATNKSKSLLPLSVHILTYSLVLLACLFTLNACLWLEEPLSGGAIKPFPVKSILLYVAHNGVLHFATDFVSSKLSSKAFAEGNISKFWAIIGADQLIHQLCLILTLPILVGV